MLFENFNDFTKAVQKKLGVIFPDCEITVHDVPKNNGIILKGITIRQPNTNIAPQIYLNPFYEEHQAGRPIDDICAEITYIHKTETTKNTPTIDMSKFMDFEQTKDEICFRLINAEKNQKMLQTIPHRMLLDFAVIYYIPVTVKENTNGSIKITDNLMQQWNVNEQTLYDLAVKNTPNRNRGVITPISMIMAEIMEQKEIIPFQTYKHKSFDITTELQSSNTPFYVATNQKQLHGATIILYPELLEQIGKYLGSFYLLPSSVHEMLLLQKTDDMSPTQLIQMVRDVNSQEVSPEDILSDNIYLYDTKVKQLSMFMEL